MKKYGKSSFGLEKFKRYTFEQNGSLLAEILQAAALYTSQPRRKRCKLCNITITTKPDFIKHTIPYAICDRCGHLNGLYEDTDAYAEAIYTSDGGDSYAKAYASTNKNDYYKRIETIYTTKAHFLLDVLKEDHCIPLNLKYTDLGGGAGYFISALRKLGVQKCDAFEVSKTQIKLAQAFGSESLKYMKPEQIYDIASKTKSQVVSMIGVLEHLQDPRRMLSTLLANYNVRYLYILVPMFSPSIFTEMVFPQVMPRNLTTGHTHLFTESSLNWMGREFKMKRIAEWWFGTDMMDLYRSVFITLGKQSTSPKIIREWTTMFRPLVDDLQLKIDEQHLSSEVHMVFKLR